MCRYLDSSSEHTQQGTSWAGDRLVLLSPAQKLQVWVRCLLVMISEMPLFKILLLVPILKKAIEIYIGISYVLKFDGFYVVLALSKSWSKHKKELVIKGLVRYEKLIKSINKFFKINGMNHIVIITDSEDIADRALAFPTVRAIKVPFTMFLGFYSPIYYGTDIEDFVMLHEYCHLALHKVLSEKHGILCAVSMPSSLAECICSAVALTFTKPAPFLKVLWRCIYFQLKWSAQHWFLEMEKNKIYCAFRIATLIEEKGCDFYSDFLEIVRKITLKPKIHVVFKIVWHVPVTVGSR